MKLMLVLGGILLALATASPALAGGSGQSADQSILAVQIGSVAASPSVAASAPVDAVAPVCVASSCDTGSAATPLGEAAAGSTGGSAASAAQTSRDSIGVVQVGSATVAPTAALAAPVNANAPVCVASACKGSGSQRPAGISRASSSGNNGRAGGESSKQSTGVAQVAGLSVAPAVAATAPAEVGAPVCVLSRCGTTQPTSSGTGPSSTTTATAATTNRPAAPTGNTAAQPSSSRPRGEEPGPRHGGIRFPSGLSPHQAQTGNGGSVLGAGLSKAPLLKVAAAKAQLPFTGLSLLAATVIGGSLLLVGGVAGRLTGGRGFRLG